MAVVNSFAKFFSANYPLEADVANTAPTYGDAINVLDGTLDPGAGGTMPDPADVRLGTAVAETTGTLAVPSPDEVLLNVATDDTLGTYLTVAAGDVREAVTFGAAGVEVGLLDLPDVSDVRLGIQFDQLKETGTLNVDTEANLPTEAQVLLDVTFGSLLQFTGSLDPGGAGVIPQYPLEIDVRVGKQYGDTGTLQYTGRYYPALVENVKAGVTYGADNVEFVGIYTPTTGTPGGTGWIG